MHKPENSTAYVADALEFMDWSLSKSLVLSEDSTNEVQAFVTDSLRKKQKLEVVVRNVDTGEEAATMTSPAFAAYFGTDKVRRQSGNHDRIMRRVQ